VDADPVKNPEADQLPKARCVVRSAKSFSRLDATRTTSDVIESINGISRDLIERNSKVCFGTRTNGSVL